MKTKSPCENKVDRFFLKTITARKSDRALLSGLRTASGEYCGDLFIGGGMEKWVNPFRGVNDFCKTCKKSCKQFENVKVVVCPNREELRSVTPLTSKHNEIVRIGLQSTTTSQKVAGIGGSHETP